MPVEERELIRQRRGQQGGEGGGERLILGQGRQGGRARAGVRRRERGRSGECSELEWQGRGVPGLRAQARSLVWVKGGTLPPPGGRMSGPSLCLLPLCPLLSSKVRDIPFHSLASPHVHPRTDPPLPGKPLRPITCPSRLANVPCAGHTAGPAYPSGQELTRQTSLSEAPAQLAVHPAPGC